MSDDFATDQAADQAAYANLAREVATPTAEDELLGVEHDNSGLDRREVEGGYREQNRRHTAGVQRQQRQAPDAHRRGPEEAQRGHKLPSIDEDPLEHFAQRTYALEQQQAAMQQQAQHQADYTHVRSTVEQAETAMRRELTDYDQACEFLESGRLQELRQIFPDAALKAQGVANPELARRQMLDNDRRQIVLRALQAGQNPALLYYQIAQSKGFKSTRGLSTREAGIMQHLMDADDPRADQVWDELGRRGLLG